MEFNFGIILAILAMVLLSYAKVTAKRVINVTTPLTAALYMHLAIASTTILLALVFGNFSLPVNWPYFLLTVIVGACAILPLYYSFERQDIGLPSAVAGAFLPVTLLLSILFYDERFAAHVWVGMALIVGGVLFAVADWKELHTPKMRRGMWLALLTLVGWGVYYFLVKQVVLEMGNFAATVALETGIFLMIVLYVILRRTPWHLSETGMRSAAITGILVGTGSLAYYSSLQYIPAGLAAAIFQVSVVMTALMSMVAFKERFDKVKTLAIVGTFVGLLLVTL